MFVFRSLGEINKHQFVLPKLEKPEPIQNFKFNNLKNFI